MYFLIHLLVTPQVRHPERTFLREGSAILAKTCHLGGDPSRKKRALDDVYSSSLIKKQNNPQPGELRKNIKSCV